MPWSPMDVLGTRDAGRGCRRAFSGILGVPLAPRPLLVESYVSGEAKKIKCRRGAIRIAVGMGSLDGGERGAHSTRPVHPFGHASLWRRNDGRTRCPITGVGIGPVSAQETEMKNHMHQQNRREGQR